MMYSPGRQKRDRKIGIDGSCEDIDPVDGICERTEKIRKQLAIRSVI